MANVFIYSGLGIMLLGAIYGLFVAIKGFRSRKVDGDKTQSLMSGFSLGPVSPEMKKLITLWAILMSAGFVVTVVGIILGLQ